MTLASQANEEPKDIIKKSVDRIPDSLKSRLSEYLKMIGLSKIEWDKININNSGIIAYNFSLRENNKCFADLSQTFEKDIFDRDRRNSAPLFNRLSENINGSDAGWFWQKAVEYSSGDKNLAMMLVGQCGHDNFDNGCNTFIGRGNYRYKQGSLGEDTILGDPVKRDDR